MASLTDSRTLARHGLRIGAYDGANRRRFVLFEKGVSRQGELVEIRREFDHRWEARAAALKVIAARPLTSRIIADMHRGEVA